MIATSESLFDDIDRVVFTQTLARAQFGKTSVFVHVPSYVFTFFRGRTH